MILFKGQPYRTSNTEGLFENLVKYINEKTAEEVAYHSNWQGETIATGNVNLENKCFVINPVVNNLIFSKHSIFRAIGIDNGNQISINYKLSGYASLIFLLSDILIITFFILRFQEKGTISFTYLIVGLVATVIIPLIEKKKAEKAVIEILENAEKEYIKKATNYLVAF